MYTETDFTCFNIGIAPRCLRPGPGGGQGGWKCREKGGVWGDILYERICWWPSLGRPLGHRSQTRLIQQRVPIMPEVKLGVIPTCDNDRVCIYEEKKETIRIQEVNTDTGRAKANDASWRRKE